MRLAGAIDVTVTPRTNGAPTAGAIPVTDGASYPVRGAPAPLSARQRENLPDGARHRGATWALYTGPEVVLSALPGDRVQWSGRTCYVTGDDDYGAHVRGLPGRVYYLAEEGSDGR